MGFKISHGCLFDFARMPLRNVCNCTEIFTQTPESRRTTHRRFSKYLTSLPSTQTNPLLRQFSVNICFLTFRLDFTLVAFTIEVDIYRCAILEGQSHCIGVRLLFLVICMLLIIKRVWCTVAKFCSDCSIQPDVSSNLLQIIKLLRT